MKVEHLREFLALAETLNFSKAAELMQVSQPVLSTHIKSVESELGFRLFERDKHSVELTEIGEELLPKIELVVHDYDSILQVTENSKRAQASQLHVGYLYNAYRRIIPNISRKFSNKYPDIALTLRSFDYLKSNEALMNGTIDVILSMDVDETLHETCYMRTLGIDDLFCVVRRDDPLAVYDEVSLADLRDEPFILPSQDTAGPYARFIENMLKRAGFTPNIAMNYHEIDTRYLAIEAGDGIGLVGGHFRPYMNEDLKFIAIKEDYSHYDLVAIWKKSNKNASIPYFIDLVESEFKRKPGGINT